MNDELANLRRQIDEIDETIIEQLVKRTQIVKQVGELKHKTTSSQCPIRSGREAEMLRRIVEKFSKSDFPAQAAASIWRIIIGASTNVESKLNISVFYDNNESRLYWLAREYFGSVVSLSKQPQGKRIIGDIIDGKSSIGVVPFPNGSDSSDWWIALIQQQGNNTPKVFARIPFVYDDNSEKDIPPTLAIARLTPEPSGDDMTLIVIEAEHNVSHNRLQTALISVQLEATWINIATINPSSRHHLIEVKGFITPENEKFSEAISNLGRSIFQCHFLGAYAVPIKISNPQNS